MLVEGPPSTGSPAVHLDIDEGVLVARVELGSSAEEAEYAFYLQRNGERIETRWYTGEPFARFATRPDAARYRTVAFVRRAGRTEPEMIVSAPVQRTPARRALGRLDGVPVRRIDVAQIGRVLRASGRLRLDVGVPGLPFDYQCLLLRKPGDRLFVILGGAVPDRSEAVLPRFSRFTWASDFPGSVLCIADPTLLLGNRIRLGWYFGNAQADASSGLCEVVLGFAAALGLRRDQIACYGSSGGGYAAMQVAARIGAGATAIAINAQTEVLRFAQEGSVDEFLTVCTGGMDRATAAAAFGSRLLLEKAWRTPSSREARCLLVQNRRDHHHLDEHLTPFAASFALPVPGTSADGRMGAMTYDFPNGHGAEPRSMLPAILERAMALRVPYPTPESP